MDKILEALIKLIPFARLFEKIGVSKELSVFLSGLISIILVISVTTLIKYMKKRYKDSKAARDLAPYFDYIKVKASCDLFIPTKFQSQSPTREDEPQFNHKSVMKYLLIPFLIKTVFNEKKTSDKFYLVLGDSGMGKTTFMINLYIQYTSFFNFGKKYKIRLYPCGDDRILDQIKMVNPKEARDTILLLDAFDEDPKLLPLAESDGLSDDQRFHRRLDEFIEIIRDFRKVVFTSRTQYFPGQEDEPYELKIRRFDEKGFHILTKLYLSPFDDKEIKRYLNKKYGVLKVWNHWKKQTATAIVKNTFKLMARPMLLSYIDYLTDKQQVFKNSYEIYETLVAKWIEREAGKRKHISECEKFKMDLDTYSRLVAVKIYQQRIQMPLLYLKKEMAIQIARSNNLDLQDYEITGQSLLTRDAEGNLKFAHKSIFGFLIAREVIAEYRIWLTQNFDDVDITLQFLAEQLPGIPLPGEFVFIKGGSFMMGSPDDETGRSDDETQHQVHVSDFYIGKYPITIAQFQTFIRESKLGTDINKTGSSKILNNKGPTAKQHPVVDVSWNEAIDYCQWLSNKLKAIFRLPTEAEWEYACRAGTTTPFNTGVNLSSAQSNYEGNYSEGKYLVKTAPVGSYPPNSWGVYDMHGNVREWCLDWHGEEYYNECNQQGIVVNPQGPVTGSFRVLRGGGWDEYVVNCRSAYRSINGPDSRDVDIGFRLVCVPT